MSDETQGAEPAQAPTHNTAEAVAFLRARCERDHIAPLVVSFSRVDPVTGEKGEFWTLNYGDNPTWSKVGEDIEAQQGACNIYWSDAILFEAYTDNTKAKKANVEQLAYLHADIDPRVDEAAQACIERTLATLQRESIPRPSLAVASGGGVQFFWRLKDALPLNGDEARAERAELYNKALAAALGGDLACCNVDHIMRVPGTINIPTKVKREKKGRTELLLARVLWDEDRVYDINEFKRAPDPNEVAAKTAKTASAAPNTAKRAGVAPVRTAAPLVESLEDPRIGMLGADSKYMMEHGATEQQKAEGKDTSRSALVFDFCCRCIRDGLPDDVLFAILVDKRWKISASVVDKAKPGRQANRDIENAHKVVKLDALALVVPRQNHMERTRIFLEQEAPHLHYYKDEFIDYADGRYIPLSEAAVRGRIYNFLDKCKGVSEDDATKVTRFNPNQAQVSETLACIKAIRAVPMHLNAPCWIDDRSINPNDCVAFPNGVLRIDTMEFMPLDPMFLTFAVLNFDYDPAPPRAAVFLDYFLPGIFDGEQDQIDLLQEVVGYCISGDCNMEKFFYISGPPGSGKDTLQKVMKHMLDESAVCGPKLESLSEKFGMEILQGKTLCIVGDMRLSGKQDSELAENILKLTGRGLFSFDRKYGSKWTGYLDTKLVILSNEGLKIRDASAAMSRRQININTRVGFTGEKADADLFEKRLAPELPAIFLWAMDGLKRLRTRKRFMDTKTAIEEREQSARDGSPELSFIEDVLVFEPDARTVKTELYEAYLDYLHEIGRTHKPDVGSFFQKYRAAVIAKGQRYSDKRIGTKAEDRKYAVIGVRIANPAKARPDKNRARDDRHPNAPGRDDEHLPF